MPLPIPPDNRMVGDSGHVIDHNEISDVLTSVYGITSQMNSVAVASPAEIPVMTGGGTSIWVQSSAPSSPALGDIWIPTTPLTPGAIQAVSTALTSLQTLLGPLAATALVATGLTGATAASRYVGATASGAPSSGTFAKGDLVIDQLGYIWLCTTAGSPGTWTRIGMTATRPIVPQAGEYLIAPNTGQTVNGLATPANGAMYLQPLDVAVAHTFVSIACCVTTAGGTGALVRMGLYADDGTGSRPAGAPLLDAGTTPSSGVATSANDLVTTISYSAAIGRLWIAMVVQGSPSPTPSFMSSTITTQIPPTSLSASGLGAATNLARLWLMNSVTGVLPTLSGISRSNAGAPYVALGA